MGVDGGVQVEVEERSGMQRGSSSLLVTCSPVYPFSHRSDTFLPNPTLDPVSVCMRVCVCVRVTDREMF